MGKFVSQPEPRHNNTMLRIARSAAKTSQVVTKRYAHGVHYGPEEPLSYYVKWLAVVGGFGGLIAYDRFYSDRAISKMLTPESNSAQIEQERQKFADRQVQEQDRNVELLFSRKRNAIEVYSPRPVPEGAHRSNYSSEVVETDNLGERRPRTVAHKEA